MSNAIIALAVAAAKRPMQGYVSLLTLGVLAACATPPGPVQQQPRIAARGPALEIEGLRFRDVNRNGVLDGYEDWRLTPSARVADLVARMTLEEKAGAMVHANGTTTPGVAAFDTAVAKRMIAQSHVTSLITRMSAPPAVLAEQNNALQEIAAATRLGVPLTISTDPRNHFQSVQGASVVPGGFSRWPEPLGFAAIGDAALVRRFAERARLEYRAVGIHMALSPQADLATEPRWPRMMGTFGEDAERAHALVRAYVEGFQGNARGVTRDGVAAIVKHWVGYGAAVDGFDGHNYYGRYVRLDGAFNAHVRPFEGAFDAQVAGVMPSYTILTDVSIDGRPVEQLAAGFSPTVLGELRTRRRYDGLILSDWAITNDCPEVCRTAARPHTFADIAMPWGMEDATRGARYVRGVEAGIDQFGGVEDSVPLIEAVRAGTLTEARLDQSVVRILTIKFALGLFEDPFVDPAEATRLVGVPEVQREADSAQARSLVVLENRDAVLPLRAGARVFLDGIDPEAARRAGLVPTPLAEAEIAVVRAAAPYETLHPNHFFGRIHHEGRLDFRDGDPRFEAIKAASAGAPTIAVVMLDRPAILTNVRPLVAGLVGEFGVSDATLLAALTGAAPPEGRLPFELPSSMAEVAAQSPGRPHDTEHPLYRIGYGLRLGAR